MKNVFGILTILIATGFLLSCKDKEVVTLQKGDSIPHFELKDQSNQSFKVADYVGQKNLVIYFYPKDDTPGCTKEACKFRDEFEVFTDLEAMVIGISADSPESHREFIKKYSLPFTLLSDEENTVRNLFGVKGNFMGIIPGRVTFIVDRKGVIQHVFDSMSDAEQHVKEAKEVLMRLKE
jgi:peroxiredoxin Q/BCP